MLLALTINDLALGEFVIVRLMERVREGAGDNVELRVNSARPSLERMTDRFERVATVLAATARPVRDTADPQGVTYLDAMGRPLRMGSQDTVGLATLPSLRSFVDGALSQRAAFPEVVASKAAGACTWWR
jgi:hypothetical protein